MKEIIFRFLEGFHWAITAYLPDHQEEFYNGFYSVHSPCHVGNKPEGYMKRRLVFTWANIDYKIWYI